MSLSVSVVVATYGRPEHVRTCLTRLAALNTPPLEVAVVDGSPDDRTTRIVRDEFPEVAYLRNELGRGTTAESRQIGFAATSGDIIAFVDDDAFAEPDWLDELIAPYADPQVVGVGGRALNGISGEESAGTDRIGLLLPDGRLTGNFAADPGRVIEVDHLLGANMSFRRSAIEAIGGIHGNYPGTCLCEESDISLRLKRDGGILVFAPRALVHHLGAPYGIGGARFDRRWLYYSRRNHIVMLARVYGWRDPIIGRYARVALREQRPYFALAWRRLLGRDPNTGASPRARATAVGPLARSAAELGGLASGFPSAAIARRRDRHAD
ncbi:glycosyltransferase family 2 protein [Microbacterium xylanilyticum]